MSSPERAVPRIPHTPAVNEPAWPQDQDMQNRKPPQRSLPPHTVREMTRILGAEPMLANRNVRSPDEVIFLRLPKVTAITGLSKSSLYELIRTNNFPAPVRIGPRIVAWVNSEVQRWAAERITASRSTRANDGTNGMRQHRFQKALGLS